jgi:hypothetical protein
MSRGSGLIGVLPGLAEGEKRGRDMICTVMEAWMDTQYLLLWQGLLSCELLNHTPSLKSGGEGTGQYSRLPMHALSLDKRTNFIVTHTFIRNLLA